MKALGGRLMWPSGILRVWGIGLVLGPGSVFAPGCGVVVVVVVADEKADGDMLAVTGAVAVEGSEGVTAFRLPLADGVLVFG